MRRHDEVSVFWRSEEGRQGWYYRVQIDGQPMKRSTGVTKHTEAGRKEAMRAAEKLASALRSKDEHKIAAVVKRPGFAKCGEVAAIYREHGPAASVTKSLSRFAAFVREVTGRQDWEEQSTHLVLTASVMRGWIATQKKAGRYPEEKSAWVRAAKPEKLSAWIRRQLNTATGRPERPDPEEWRQIRK
jgi:hypothetical protein